jgi:hypothetical protein
MRQTPHVRHHHDAYRADEATGRWLLAGTMQTGGYSAASHDVSDLGALTEQSPLVMLTAQGIAGALTIAFALLALQPALAVPGRRAALGAWLLAASLMGLDNLSDAFFRLDCRAADPGCTAAAADAQSSIPGLPTRPARS